MRTEYIRRPWSALLGALADRIREGALATDDDRLVQEAAAEIERLHIAIENRRNRMIDLQQQLEKALNLEDER